MFVALTRSDNTVSSTGSLIVLFGSGGTLRLGIFIAIRRKITSPVILAYALTCSSRFLKLNVFGSPFRYVYLFAILDEIDRLFGRVAAHNLPIIIKS